MWALWYLLGRMLGRNMGGRRPKRDRDGMETLHRPEEWD